MLAAQNVGALVRNVARFVPFWLFWFSLGLLLAETYYEFQNISRFWGSCYEYLDFLVEQRLRGEVIQQNRILYLEYQARHGSAEPHLPLVPGP